VKVLLFVQTGDARPKCVSRNVGFDPAERLQGQKWLADSGYYVWWNVHDKATRADRWWLVECWSADEGRRYIRDQYMDDAPGYRADCASHILASGGKQ